MRTTPTLFVTAVALAFALAAGEARAVSNTLGHSLINRPNHDGAVGSIFLLDEQGAAGTVSEFGFFENDFAGRQITPVILKATGTGFAITGIGTTRASDGTGAQTHPFGLVSGSDQMGLGYAFGWKDGSNGTNNAGVPEFDLGGGGEVAWSGGAVTSFSVGTTNSFGTRLARTYSLQATVESQDELVGNVLGNRGANNGAVGSIFILDDPFTHSGLLTEWAFYDDDNDTPNGSITPLLLKPSGADWEIIGVGQTVVSDELGAQYFDFDLVEGTDGVGPDVYFGWKDGSDGADNDGVIDYDDVAGGPQVFWLGPNRTSFNPGDTFPVSLTLQRTYSIQGFAQVPEPASAALGLLGLAALGLVMRRRRA